VLSDKEKKLIEHFSILGKQTTLDHKVNCFSYKGDIFCLKKGSNLLDFAHRIHTDLATAASSGLVNGEEKNLYSKIEEGDMIRILTNQDSPLMSDLSF
jgi:GTP pyrophosphokinase